MNGYAANLIARARGGIADITPRPATPYEPVAAPDGSPVLETPEVNVSKSRSHPPTPNGRPSRATDHAADAPEVRPAVSPEPKAEAPGLLMPVDRETIRRDEVTTRSPEKLMRDVDSPSPEHATPFAPENVGQASTESPAAENSHAGSSNESESATSAPEPARRNAAHTEVATRIAPARASTDSRQTDERDSMGRAGTVHVHIGRVEVRAQFAAPPAPVRRPVPRSAPTISLEDYLKTGTGGGS